MVVHNEYIGWQIEWPASFQGTLHQVLRDEELWDELLEFVHKKYPNVDTFHTDGVTFLYAFSDMAEARIFEREMKKRICHWIEAYT
jgi:hypothetical protein